MKLKTNSRKNIYIELMDFDKSNLINEEINVNLFLFLKIKFIERKKDNGKDITHNIGYRYWYKDKFLLKKGVFIPQWDTEGIIDLAPENKNGIELGAGSGVISATLSKHKNNKMTAFEIERKAYALSKKNFDKLNVEVEIHKGDFFKYDHVEKYDFLISNPPYIEQGDSDLDVTAKKIQPKNALYAEQKGLEYYYKLITDYETIIKPGGKMLFEIGFKQKEDLESFLKSKNKKYNFYKDLSGNWRFLEVFINEA